MQINSIIVKNFRPFKELQETKLGQMATIVGKNDAGKSSVLQAIDLFLDSKPEIEQDDFHDTATKDENIIIECSFSNLPKSVQLEDTVETTLQEEMLLDENSFLRIRKTFSKEGKVVEIVIVTKNFQDKSFAELTTAKETDLNRLCKENDIEGSKSGRGITNKEKRKALRGIAQTKGISVGKYELKLQPKDGLCKTLESLLPIFSLYRSEQQIDIAGAAFQKEFRPIVNAAVSSPDVATQMSAFSAFI